MKSIFVEKSEELKLQLENLLNDLNTLSVLIFIAEEDKLEDKLINNILRNFSKPIIGGVFPEIIFESKRKKSGIMLYSLPYVLETNLIDLSKSEEEINQEIIKSKKSTKYKNIFVFVDSLSENKSIFIESIYNNFGNNFKYFGGGAGSLSFEKISCVLDNNGLKNNAAIMAFNNIEMELGVAHGWNSISEKLKVTETNENEIISINWEPAFKVYSKIVENDWIFDINSNFF